MRAAAWLPATTESGPTWVGCSNCGMLAPSNVQLDKLAEASGVALPHQSGEGEKYGGGGAAATSEAPSDSAVPSVSTAGAGSAVHDVAAAGWMNDSCVCELGCGQMYCSQRCRAAAGSRGHSLTCVGPLSSEEHPLYQFKLLALQSWIPDEMKLAAELLVQSACAQLPDDSPGSATSTTNTRPDENKFPHREWVAGLLQHCAGLPLWWTLMSAEDIDAEEQAVWVAEAEELACEGWDLLKAALTTEVAAPVSHGVAEATAAAVKNCGQDGWGRLLTFVAAERVVLSCTSPIGGLCRTVASNRQAYAAVGKTIVACVRHALDEEAGGEDMHTLSSLGEEAASAAEGGGIHGHSHNGEPCHGHGHGGQDSHGHGHGHDEAALQVHVIGSGGGSEGYVDDTLDEPSGHGLEHGLYEDHGIEEEEEEEEEEEDEDPHCAMNAGLRGLDDEHLLNRVLAGSERFFPSVDVVGIFPELSALTVHSCAPTSAITIADSNGESDPCRRSLSCAMTTRPGMESGAASVARVDVSDDLAERAASYSGRGLQWLRTSFGKSAGTTTCACNRCLFEQIQEASTCNTLDSEGGAFSTHNAESSRDDGGDDPDVTKDLSFSTADLKLLASAAQVDGRYLDALNVYAAILTRDSNDHDALYGRARVLGWNDQFKESAASMRVAAEHGSPEAVDSCRAALLYAPNQTLQAAEESPEASLVEGLGDRAFVIEGLIPAQSCANAVEAVEAHLQSNGGWTTSRHYSVPTTDIPIHQVPVVLDWFNNALANLRPHLGKQFNANPEKIRVIDAFVVKYHADLQRFLPLHCDQSQFSLTIAMNSLDEYDGGGTFFADIAEPVNCDVGGVIAFDGTLLHGGNTITRGVRYIAVAFLYEG